MKIEVKLFASFREIAGTGEITLELKNGETVSSVLSAVGQRFPRLSLAHIMVAVNQEFAAPAYVLKDGDEVALLPPVSGG